MRRRDLIAAGSAVTLAAATPVLASETAPAEGASLSIGGVGLPVIVDGRLENYVFVSVKLYLGGGQTAETMRGKDPYFRDGLVRAAHRADLTVADDWTRLNENAINAAIMAMAPLIADEGAVIRSEVTTQAPRRRTGIRSG